MLHWQSLSNNDKLMKRESLQLSVLPNVAEEHQRKTNVGIVTYSEDIIL